MSQQRPRKRPRTKPATKAAPPMPSPVPSPSLVDDEPPVSDERGYLAIGVAAGALVFVGLLMTLMVLAAT